VLRLVPPNGATTQAAATDAGTKSVDSRSAAAETGSSALRAIATPWLALLLFGFFLGLAVLAKGPAAIILCGGAVFFWALFTKRWRDAFRLLHPAAIAAFCITALPWYILCARRNPNFLRIFIIEHNFKRFLTPEFQHIQPLWFYAPILVLALVPWAVPFLWDFATHAVEFSRWRRMDAASYFFLFWSGFTFLFFTISRSKLPGYILPAIPLLALFVAHGIKHRTERPRTTRVYIATAGATLILLGLVVMFRAFPIPFVTDAWPPNGVATFQIIALVGGSLAIVFALRRRPALAAGLVILCTLAFLTVDTGELWALDAGVSARPAVRDALEHMTREQAATAAVFKLRRAYKFQVDFYLHRETQEWSPNGQEHSIVFTDYKNSAEFVRLGGRCPRYIAFPAVWVCEDSNDGQILMNRPAGSGQP
jgi:4-amino-4-deoxy-L-arabinose transferase-like glycosyltransferase